MRCFYEIKLSFAILLTLVVAISCAARAVAQDLRPDPESNLGQIDQLSEGSYAERQRATLQMWRIRDQSRDRVQQAAKHPDPEIAGRAQWILRQWRRGSLPGTPPEISRLLAKSPGAEGINQLILEGQFVAARVATEESIGTADFESIQQRVHLTLVTRFPACVHAAMKHDSLHDLLDLIDMIATTKEVAVTRVDLMQELGLDIDAEGLLPRSAAKWSESLRIEAEVLVLANLGRFDDAIEVAKRSSNKQLLYAIRMIAGRWQDAMHDALIDAKASESGSAEHARWWSRVMTCADHAGDAEVFQRAATELTSADVSNVSSARDLRWRTLASHGQVDAAIDMLKKYDRRTAAKLSIAASRIGSAFDLLNFPLEQIDSQIDAWTDVAIQSQMASKTPVGQQGELTEPVSDLLILIRCLITIGREDIARSAVKRLCESNAKVGSLRLRDHVLDSLRLTPRSDWIVEFALSDGEKMVAPIVKSILQRSLQDGDVTSMELVIEALTLQNRSQDPKERIADAYMVMRGELPSGVDAATLFKKLHDLAIMPGRSSGRRVPGRFPAFAKGRVRGTLSLVRLFLQHDQTEFANAIIRKLAETGQQEALLMMAEQELDAGSTELAAVLFDSLSETAFHRSAGAVVGQTRSDELAIQSLVGLWRIAKRNGDIQRANELLKEIQIGLYTPSTRLRSAAAKYLVDRNESALATEVFERLLPIVMFENEERTGIYSVARNYATFIRDTDVGKAANWYDLGVCDVIRSGGFSSGAYVSIPVFLRRWAIESAIDRKDESSIRRHIDRIMELNPLDITLAEATLPKIRDAGFAQLADPTLDQIVQIGTDYCRRFPDDATTANNLAWVAAMNGQHLQTAFELSQQAVYCEPDSAIYRDTLAEILYRLGRFDEALQVEQACLLDEKSDWHIHTQVEKYRKASRQ